MLTLVSSSSGGEKDEFPLAALLTTVNGPQRNGDVDGLSHLSRRWGSGKTIADQLIVASDTLPSSKLSYSGGDQCHIAASTRQTITLPLAIF